jgi:hypothetical protein
MRRVGRASAATDSSLDRGKSRSGDAAPRRDLLEHSLGRLVVAGTHGHQTASHAGERLQTVHHDLERGGVLDHQLSGGTGCKAILQVDRIDPDGRRHAEAALTAMKPDLLSAGVSVDLQETDARGTARRWFFGLVRAFGDPETIAALLIPGDLTRPFTDEQVQLLQTVIRSAESNALHPVDYTTEDAFKASFDALVARPTIELVFPDLAPRVREIGLGKLRTEIVLVGRDVLGALDEASFESGGPDPTPQWILTVLRHPQLRVKQPVNLGLLDDEKGRRHPLGQFGQIVRFVQQMLLDRTYEDVWKGYENPDQQLGASDRLRGLLGASYALTLDAIDTNRERLQPRAKLSAGGVGQYRAVYARPEAVPLANRLQALYDGTVRETDPLYRLLSPVDQRGEVQAWGGVHLTILDALTVRDPNQFVDIVRKICRSIPSPTVTATGLVVWGKNLVLKCDSPALARIRSALITATRQCLEKSPLTDEEIQRAYWWIWQRAEQPEKAIEVLSETVKRYVESGSPALPHSRHFRLNYLVHLVRRVLRAKDDDKAAHERHLKHFLEHGEPHWYAANGALHLTIASGLVPGADAGALARDLAPGILADCPPFPLAGLAIMAEAPESPVRVRFYDELAQGFVTREARPGFKVLGCAEFASC